MTPQDNAAPGLEEQIAHARQRVESQAKHVAAGFDGGNNLPELRMREAILASLVQLQQRMAEPVSKGRNRWRW